jgi:hypothetical protein
MSQLDKWTFGPSELARFGVDRSFDALASFNESNEHISRLFNSVGTSSDSDLVARFGVDHAALKASFDALFRIDENMKPSFAAIEAEERVAKIILEVGFAPHPEMFDVFSDQTLPADVTMSVFSQTLANSLWPKLRSRLELSLADCLSDEKLFHTFNDLMKAHDSGLYQITIPAAVLVIERAALVAQRHREAKTMKWLDAEIGKLPCTALPRSSWRIWSILLEYMFAQCWSDVQADAIPFPNRHASAHGRGKRLASIVDSLNAVLMAHFVIASAAAFDHYKKDQPLVSEPLAC